MERHVVVLAEEFLRGVEGLDAFALNLVVGHEHVEGGDVHAEALGDASHVAAYLAEGVDAEGLALEFGAGFAVVAVAGHEDEHAEYELGDGVGVLAGGVHDADAALGGGGQVDVIVAGAGTNDDFQLGSGGHDFAVNLVGADDETLDIGDCLEEVFAGALLYYFEVGAGGINHVCYGLYGCRCERLLGENEYLHL